MRILCGRVTLPHWNMLFCAMDSLRAVFWNKILKSSTKIRWVTLWKVRKKWYPNLILYGNRAWTGGPDSLWERNPEDENVHQTLPQSLYQTVISRLRSYMIHYLRLRRKSGRWKHVWFATCEFTSDKSPKVKIGRNRYLRFYRLQKDKNMHDSLPPNLYRIEIPVIYLIICMPQKFQWWKYAGFVTSEKLYIN